MKTLCEKAKENIIIVAHRGAAGGNIPCNTMAAYEIALKQGADMLEADLNCSRDGQLFLFHPMMELSHMNLPLLLNTLSYKAVSKMHYVNFDRTKTQFTVPSFDDFLEQFKGRCYINIDKFWSNPQKIYEAIKRHGMTDQCLVKSKPSEKVFRLLEEMAPELPYMPIVRDSHELHGELLKRNINYVGVEALFRKDTEYLASDEFIEKMHRDGVLVWANSIIFDYRQQLAGGHSDDTALTESEDKGWGWLADKGFDFIQTDWTMMLIDYLKRTDRYYKKGDKMNKNRLIIFDCFGVIFEEIAPVFFRNHFEEKTAAALKEKYFVPADRGEITREELFDLMSAELGMKKEDILSEWETLIRLRPYMVPVIEKLRETADIALLSNAPTGFVEKLFAENNLNRLFDKVFVSSALKMAKPDAEIYLHCVSSFGKEYDEIFMIDDSLKNLEKLPEIGITPVLFTDVDSMLAALGEKITE